MIAAVKAEFKKLLTVRSTYIILGIALALELLFAFYGSGWKAQAVDLRNTGYLASQVDQALAVLMLLAAIIAILLITHEYRYNTIMHTLTSNRSRTTVFVSKLLTLSIFAIIFALVYGTLSPLLALAGLNLHNLHLVHQNIQVWSLFWRTVFYGWGFVMFAAIIAFLIRNQIGAIVALFLIPSTIEQLIGALINKNQVYLPFTALHTLVRGADENFNISHERAALVALAYIVVGWVVAWYLFLKRDAS